MSGKAFFGATIVGGIVSFLVGYLLWGMLLMDFFASNAGSATGVAREPMNMGLLFLGVLIGAGLLTLIIGWAKADGAGQGAKVGAMVGALMSLNIGIIQLAATNLNTPMSVLGDAAASLVHGGIVGAVIAVTAGKLGAS